MKRPLPIILISAMLLTCGCSNTYAPSTGAETGVTSPAPESESAPAPSEENDQSDVSGNESVQAPEPPKEELPKTVTILGNEIDTLETYIDLSSMTPEDVEDVAKALSEMTALSEINLMDEEGQSLLETTDVLKLKEVSPDAHFIYEFDLFGQRITTSDTEVSFIRQAIGDEGEQEIRNALSLLENCEYFLLDDCGISDEIMDGIRNDYPDTKVVWRIHVGTRSALTDDQVIRMTHGINDSMTGPLKYCHDVVYMDLGHDSGITDISFIQYMPLLECIILSDAKMTDITPLSYCHNLTWVELVYCDRLRDITPIIDLESVKYLNISYSGIRDITPIDGMNLDRFCAIAIGVSDEQLEEYRKSHPDCLAINSGNPYGYAWRYNDYGYHFFWYYARMREAFRYDQGSPGGFKLPEVWINYPPEEIPEEDSSEEAASTEEISEDVTEADASEDEKEDK